MHNPIPPTDDTPRRTIQPLRDAGLLLFLGLAALSLRVDLHGAVQQIPAALVGESVAADAPAEPAPAAPAVQAPAVRAPAALRAASEATGDRDGSWFEALPLPAANALRAIPAFEILRVPGDGGKPESLRFQVIDEKPGLHFVVEVERVETADDAGTCPGGPAGLC